MTVDAAQILTELVAIDSVSDRPNRPIIDWLAQWLEKRGFELHFHRYRDERGVEKLNLVAVAGPKRQPIGAGGLALAGHTDTVPYDPAWTDALRVTERDGKIYGRGTADTKGFIAASLAAIDRTGTERLQEPLVCIFTADEEVGCVGARKLLAELEVRPAHVIVGEPTRLVPIRSHKGYWLAEIEFRGGEGHSAFPSVGRSAILDAGRLLCRLESVQKELEGDPDPTFDPPFTTLNVGTIEGGKARNVIAGRCAFPLEWRPIPHQEGEKVARILRRELDEIVAEDPGVEASFVVSRTDPAVATPPDAAIVRFLEQATGNASTTIPFGTELPYFDAVGTLGCVCGPGDIRTAHRTGEYVDRAELDRAVEIYVQAIEHFCRGN